MATDLTRQQLCASLGISESTVRRLELLGLPFTPVGLRAALGGPKWVREQIEKSARAAGHFTS